MAIDHDGLFKELLTTFFYEFLTAFAPQVAGQLAPSPLVFLDKEQLATIVDPGRRETDIVALAQLPGQQATILIHLEHQAQRDRATARRMFRYFARFYDRYDTPIYPIVLCSYPSPLAPAPTAHRMDVLGEPVLDFRYRVI